jgi:ParB family chromosome partitioning protein
MHTSKTLQSDSTIQRLPITQIRPAPERHYFGKDALDSLADRMAEHGLIEPIIVRKTGETFEIVSGKRRWRAAIKLGWRSIDARIQSD